MRRVRWAKLGSSAALCLGAAPAWGQPALSSYALSWVRAEGAEECPTARALATEVERRLGRVVFDPAAARSFEVQVTRVAGRYRSDVFVRDEAGRAVGHRTLENDEPGCQALFGATALAIALVIDPEAAGRQPAATAAFEASPPAPPPPLPAPPPAVPPTPPPRLAPPAPQPPAVPVTLSLRGHVSGALVPTVSPGVALAFSARPSARWGFSASAWYVAPQTARQGEGDFSIGLTRGSLAVTFDAAASERVRLVLQAGPSVGAFHLAVRAPAPVTDPGDFWFAAFELGVGLQLAISERVFLELGGAGLAPLLRQEFSVRDESEPVWEQGLVAGTAYAGLGARFP
ncbi:MAG TPA: hypothetical protein VEX18_11850 [Polyangiaceae bacterium]|nr:hypothetical protein [Polyangiaceae bacterium]